MTLGFGSIVHIGSCRISSIKSRALPELLRSMASYFFHVWGVGAEVPGPSLRLGGSWDLVRTWASNHTCNLGKLYTAR